MRKIKNILVTGGAGFIGSEVCRQLADAGHKVTIVDKLTYASTKTTIEPLLALHNVCLVEEDICNTLKIRSILNEHKIDKVMHLAAESHVDKSISGPEDFIVTNVLGTYRLLAATLAYYTDMPSKQKKEFAFHHISTDEVYGDLQMNDPAFTEEHAYKPSSPYSASKASSDHLVRAWQRTYQLPTIITNCSNNYGHYQYPEKLIPLMIIRAIRSQALPVYGTGSNIRDWIHVQDHAMALIRVIQQGIEGETYNIGGDCEISNIDVVKQICKHVDIRLGRNAENTSDKLITFVEDRPGHDMRYAINSSKMNTELNWKPMITFQEGLKQTVDWYIDHGHWWEPLLEENNA